MSVNFNPLNIDAKGMKTIIAQFNPFLDEYRIMRSKSRLSNLRRDYDTTHPVILHNHLDSTKLLDRNLHFKFKHPVRFTMKITIRKLCLILRLGTTLGSKLPFPKMRNCMQNQSFNRQHLSLKEELEISTKKNSELPYQKWPTFNRAKTLDQSSTTWLEKFSRRSNSTDGTKKEMV